MRRSHTSITRFNDVNGPITVEKSMAGRLRPASTRSGSANLGLEASGVDGGVSAGQCDGSPPEGGEAASTELEKAPSIGKLPDLDPLPDDLEVTIAIGVGDDVSTDEILQAGAEALPHRSNIAKLAEFTFRCVDQNHLDRVRGDDAAHAVVAGRNYGQGSSREHAVLAPRSLGLRVVLAPSYARIHWQNLVNFGVLPLEYDDVPGEIGDRLVLHAHLRAGTELTVVNTSRNTTVPVRHRLSPRQIDTVLAGGRIPEFHG
jgi:aconitate hydratase